MGLFSKKAPCPICGGKISMFLPTKIGGEHICDECAGKLDVQNELKEGMTIPEFKEYLMFYEENCRLREKFVVSQKLDFGCFDTKLMFDFQNKLFCMSKNLDKTIFEGSAIKSFTIKEDSHPLFEGGENGLKRYVSTVPERVMALAPQIAQFIMNERLVDAIDKMGKDDEKRNNYHPDVEIPEPFREFYVEINMEHPYWEVIRCDMSAPTFSRSYPDANDYMNDYQRDVEVMDQLAKAFMDVAFPGKGEVVMGGGAGAVNQGATAAVPAAAAGDAIEDIKKYKALMEEGIITKEEFDLKKKQLLGI